MKMVKALDLTGQKFGKWTVVKRSKNDAQGKATWLCKCKCGTEKSVNASSLLRKLSRSCGCSNSEGLIDLTGLRFGKLLVIRRSGSGRSGKSKWLCRCDCGNEKSILGCSLRNGRTRSCGCSSEKQRPKDGWHKDKKPEYTVWIGIKQRCYNPKASGYSYYGERGIRVCERWLNSFDDFYFDMGPKPSPKHSIDRIDVNGNYEPSNCKWATPNEQARNKRDSKENQQKWSKKQC